MSTTIYTPPGPDDWVVAIDLGTTTTSVAVYRDGSVESIEASTGQYTTPSVVAFTPDELLVGAAAMEQRNTANAANYLFGIKRLIGRKYNDPEIQQDLETWPFKVVEDPQQPNRALIQVEFLNTTQHFAPEEISAFLLAHIRRELSTRLGRDTKHCVITVPAYFNDAQRNATKAAGVIAGWNVVRIINEPTAAAFYNSVRHITHQLALNVSQFKKTILIVDLGGGTYDVSAIRIDHDAKHTKVETLSTCGDSHFGGEDIDVALVKYFYDMINTAVQKSTGDATWDLRKNNAGRVGQRRFARLRQECIRAKEDLSIGHSTPLNLSDIEPKCDVTVEFTRNDFNKLIKPLLQRVMTPIENSLKEANLQPKDVDDVVLVGGSSRIPAIKEALKNLFSAEQIKELFSEADVSVSRGAAVVAASCAQHKQQKLSFEMNLVDITSHALFRLSKMKLESLVPKNTPIPHRHQFFVTKQPGRTSLSVVLYETEGAVTAKEANNFKLGTLRIEDLDPEDENELICTLTIDENGIIALSVLDQENNVEKTIQFDKNDLNSSEILFKRDQFLKIDENIKNNKIVTEKYTQLLEKMREYDDLVAKADVKQLEHEIAYQKYAKLQAEINNTIIGQKRDLAVIQSALLRLHDLPGLVEVIQKFSLANQQPDGDDEEFDFDF